jgi:hypothetical protein
MRKLIHDKKFSQFEPETSRSSILSKEIFAVSSCCIGGKKMALTVSGRILDHNNMYT